MNGDVVLSRFCMDSECPGIAQPEEELAEGGMLRWWVCDTCSMEFDYQMIEGPEGNAGRCQLGIPEAVRKAASVPDKTAPVFLGATISRRP